MNENPRPASAGRIFQLNTSNGGVPKRAIPAGEITVFGLSGDHQQDQEVHGGPNAALCLYSLERILELQQEGNPIYPGAVGENLTLVGVDWTQMEPGVRLRLGSEVLVEITKYTAPCKTIAAAFHDQNSNRIGQKLYPGWSRVYARVLQPGFVRVGDRAQIVASG